MLLVFTISSNPAAAVDPFGLSLLKLADLTSKYGSPIDTYEDVYKIEDIRPFFSGVGPIIGTGELSSSYNKNIKEADGKKFLAKIAATGGMVYKDKTFTGFLEEHLYLDAGSFDDMQVWHDDKVPPGGFPFDYDPKERPHEKKYYLCLLGGWQYLPVSNDLEPDAKSCDKNRDWCTEPECKKGKQEDISGDGDFDDPEDINESDQHDRDKNNVYTDLGNKLKHRAVSVTQDIDMNTSGMEFKMNFKDRTPPLIDGCADDKFPELGAAKPATTGDWYKVEGLKITDNKSKFVGTCLVLGIIDKYPSTTWQKEENWKAEPPRKIKSGDDTDYVILPNSCHGVMRYSVFAWDESGNVNPGEPRLINDRPDICYNLSDPPVRDLLREPDKAMGWPIIATITGELEDVDPAKIDGGERRGEGIVHIRDNDLPNLVICIESVKDNKKIFFPPVMPPGSLPILNSTEFETAKADPEGNAKAYQKFVGTNPDIKFDSKKIADPLLNIPLYFKILDVRPPKTLSFDDPGMATADISKLDLFKADNDFIRAHFRLEDFVKSDTKIDGTPDTDAATYGERNGFGGEICALLTTPLQEDVEYKVSVWADDNVKWATVEAGKVLEKIIAIPTGIVAGELKVEATNQYPTASYRMPFDRAKAVTEPLTVVFREPTKLPGGKLEPEKMHAQRVPFVEAIATDYAGNTRKIKLFLEISNENPEIRVLERSHEKND